MFDASDAIVIACAAFSIGMFAGVWVYAGRADRRDAADPMAEPFGDLPPPPVRRPQSSTVSKPTTTGGSDGV